MLQYRINWSVPNAGPSVTVLHTANAAGDDPTAYQPALQAFIATLAGSLMPDNVSLQLHDEVRKLDPATGALQAVLPITPAAADFGSSAAVWSAGSGARIDWLTGAIVNGRQLRGRSFIVPLVQSAFDTNGTVASGAITTISGAASTLLGALVSAGGSLQVWHRPVNGSGGQMEEVTSAVVPALPATLRERKY